MEREAISTARNIDACCCHKPMDSPQNSTDHVNSVLTICFQLEYHQQIEMRRRVVTYVEGDDRDMLYVVVVARVTKYD